MLPAHVMTAALVIALAVDRWCGEPPNRWHPVVWIGRYLGGPAGASRPPWKSALFLLEIFRLSGLEPSCGRQEKLLF